MAIIVVGGSKRGVGKTTLVCSLIAALRDLQWTAVKIARDDHGIPDSVWEEKSASQEADTSRYLAAGAARAFLVTAPMSEGPDGLRVALNQLWPLCGRGTNLIFESNSVVHHVSADVCLMIHAVPMRTLPLPERKQSFIAAIGHADAAVTLATADGMIPDGLRIPDREPRPIFHLANFTHIPIFMQEWLRPRLGTSVRAAPADEAPRG